MTLYSLGVFSVCSENLALCAFEPLSLCVKNALALSSLLAHLAICFSSLGVMSHRGFVVQMFFSFFFVSSW
jgi:hypothetical protein